VSLCSLVTSYLNQEIGQTNSFNAFLYLIQFIIASPMLKGLIFCGILSVMFSTMDAAINSANISLINDIIKNKILPDLDDKHDHKMIKISSLIICIICFVLCYFVKNLMSVVIFSINIWASTITIPLFARMSNIKAPFYMFYVCGLCGVVINILYYSYDFMWLKSLGVVSSSIIIESIIFMSMKFLISKFGSAGQKIYH
jgi:Na+/proline symporter